MQTKITPTDRRTGVTAQRIHHVSVLTLNRFLFDVGQKCFGWGKDLERVSHGWG
jgi:hypothetical protein